jgi:hypothetical protein
VRVRVFALGYISHGLGSLGFLRMFIA